MLGMKESSCSVIAPVKSTLPLLSAALAALGLVSSAQAQVQTAGDLLVSVDATAAPAGTLTSITNMGTLGGYFEARGGVGTIPVVESVHGNGTLGLRFDGNQYLQLVPALGASPTAPPGGITGVNPTFSIEAWVLNPSIQQEETIVSWGRRGGPDGSNCSLNYGWDAAWGAMGHWGAADMGWDSSTAASGVYPAGVPAPGVWHHVVYTFDGAVQRVYSDGVLKNSEAIGLNLPTGTAITMAAQLEPDATTVTAALRGSLSIGRLRIHDEALSASQVLNNYNFEAGSFSNGGSPLPFRPTHRYSFNQAAGSAPDGTTVTDSVAGANGFIRGAGAAFTGSRVTLPGGSSATQAYIDLPNGLLSVNSTNNGGPGEFTVEGWVKITGAHTWSRIFDFGSSDIGGGVGGEVTGAGGGGEGKDYIFWSAQNGDNQTIQTIAWRNIDPVDPGAPLNGGGVDHYTSSAITTPKDIHILMTWNERTGEIDYYENGTQLGSMTMPIAMSDIHDVNVWLGRSNWSVDQDTQAEYDEFRFYNHVLSPAQIEASYQAGPNVLATADPVNFVSQPQSQTINELGSATFSAVPQGAPPISIQWYRNNTAIPGQTNLSVTFSNVPATFNGSQIYAIGSNYISGSAFTATSSVVTLTVVADTTPPTLVLARVDSLTVAEVLFSEAVHPEDLVLGNFSLSGPAGAPTIVSVAPGSDARRAILTLSGPLGCAYYTVTVSNVRDVSSAANVIAPGSTIGLWNLVAPGATHRYTFNNPAAPDASGATVPDILNGADAIVRNGFGTTALTGDRLTLSGGPSTGAPYVDLPNGLLSVNSTNNGGSGQVTVEGWVKVTGNHSWSRLFDFGSSGPCCNPGLEVLGPGGGDQGIDYFFLSAQIGTDTGRHRIDLSNRDQGDHGTVGSEFNSGTFNSEFHFVVTWDETSGAITVYENGVQAAAMTTVAAMSEINDVNVWLGRSNWAPDENLQGEYDEFRIYNRVLTPTQIRLDTAGGADGNFGAPLSIDLVVTNHTMYTNSTRPLPLLVRFANAGTQDVAASGCVTYTSSDPTIAQITSDGLLHTYGIGTAVVTAAFGGVQESETIMVTGDNTPPFIVSARDNGSRLVEVTYSEPVDPFSAGEPTYYSVSGPSGALDIDSATVESDPRKVLLTLSSPMNCEYITVQAYAIADLVGNANVDSGSASFLHFAPLALQHRYSFNNASNSVATDAVVPDGIGTGDAVIHGTPKSFNGDRVVLNGGGSGAAGYVDLPNGLLSSHSTNNGGSGQLSFEGWAKVTGNQNWSRLLDIGSSGPCCAPGGEILGPGGSGDGIDYLMLSAEVGTDTGHRRLELQNRDDSNNHGFVNSDYPTATYGQEVHYVITWDEATGTIRAYENGVQVTSMQTVAAMSEINDVNVWLGRSTWTQDQNLQGEYDEFRVYNRVLAPSEIVVNDTVGPDNNYGAPLAVRLPGPTLLHVGQAANLPVRVDFANISNVDLTLAGCAGISSSDNTVISNDAAGLLHAVGAGTATITATFSGISSSLAITVTNGAPVAGDDGIVTSKGVPVTVSIATLLANDTDPDGNSLNITGTSATSTNGGTVSLAPPSITYTPVSGYTGLDLFTYTVSDGFGASSTGRVFVNVVEGQVPTANHITIGSHTGGGYALNFRGTPGTTYRIQRAPNVTGPWSDIATQTASPTGIISTVDSTPLAGQAFYRVITP